MFVNAEKNEEKEQKKNTTHWSKYFRIPRATIPIKSLFSLDEDEKKALVIRISESLNTSKLDASDVTRREKAWNSLVDCCAFLISIWVRVDVRFFLFYFILGSHDKFPLIRHFLVRLKRSFCDGVIGFGFLFLFHLALTPLVIVLCRRHHHHRCFPLSALWKLTFAFSVKLCFAYFWTWKAWSTARYWFRVGKKKKLFLLSR